jgi:hypothetical protein
MIKRNPGVTLLWVTRYYQIFEAGNGQLLRIGDPIAVEWWSEGRAATRDEVLESIETGLPSLEDLARLQGAEAVQELVDRRGDYLRWVDSCFVGTPA